MDELRVGIIESMFEAVSETLETMVFMEVTRAEPDGKSFPEITEPIWAEIDILKPLSAKVRLVIPEELTKEITSNLFGFEDSDSLSDQLLLDATSELLNTIAGRFMARMTPPDKELALGLPACGKGLDAKKLEIACNMSADGHYFYLCATKGLLGE